MTHYTNGPTDQPWEVEPIGLHADVQRRGFRSRLFDQPDSREWLFELNTETQAREIAARLNRLDVLEAENAALKTGLGICDAYSPQELEDIAWGHRITECDFARQRDTAQARNDALEVTLRRLVEAVKEYVDDYEALATCPCEECQLFRAAQAAREVLDG